MFNVFVCHNQCRLIAMTATDDRDRDMIKDKIRISFCNGSKAIGIPLERKKFPPMMSPAV